MFSSYFQNDAVVCRGHNLLVTFYLHYKQHKKSKNSDLMHLCTSNLTVLNTCKLQNRRVVITTGTRWAYKLILSSAVLSSLHKCLHRYWKLLFKSIASSKITTTYVICVTLYNLPDQNKLVCKSLETGHEFSL